MIIPTNADKAFDKTPTHSHDKTLYILGMEGNFLILIKVIYEKPTADIMLNDEGLKSLPLKVFTPCS